jgi:hypothetical protein
MFFLIYEFLYLKLNHIILILTISLCSAGENYKSD